MGDVHGRLVHQRMAFADDRIELYRALPGHGADGPTLEIFSYDEMEQQAPMMANHQGFTHIAFEIDDFDETYARALDRGAMELGRPTERQIPDVGVLKFVYLRDPEGNIVEIQASLTKPGGEK